MRMLVAAVASLSLLAIDNLWANQTLGAPFSEVVHTLN